MTKYPRVLSAFFGSCWAILPDKFEAMADLLALRAAGGRLSPDEIKVKIGKRKKPSLASYFGTAALVEGDILPIEAAARNAPPAAGAVAVLNLYGVVDQRANMMTDVSGGVSCEAVGSVLDDLVRAPQVSAIVLNVDSPGGSVFGVSELGQKIYKARAKKPVIAVANSLAASAGYWLASAAGEFYCTPGGQVGSVGVFATHLDESKANEQEGLKYTFIQAGKFKTEGNPFEPLADEARQNTQGMVDRYYDDFVSAVARNRNATPGKVKSDFGQGRLLLDTDAKAAGMVDGVATLEQVLRDLGGRLKSSAVAAAAEPLPIAAGPAVGMLKKRLDLSKG